MHWYNEAFPGFNCNVEYIGENGLLLLHYTAEMWRRVANAKLKLFCVGGTKWITYSKV